jgi:hypothetical protein
MLCCCHCCCSDYSCRFHHLAILTNPIQGVFFGDNNKDDVDIINYQGRLVLAAACNNANFHSSKCSFFSSNLIFFLICQTFGFQISKQMIDFAACFQFGDLCLWLT